MHKYHFDYYYFDFELITQILLLNKQLLMRNGEDFDKYIDFGNHG